VTRGGGGGGPLKRKEGRTGPEIRLEGVKDFDYSRHNNKLPRCAIVTNAKGENTLYTVNDGEGYRQDWQETKASTLRVEETGRKGTGYLSHKKKKGEGTDIQGRNCATDNKLHGKRKRVENLPSEGLVYCRARRMTRVSVC